MNRQHNGAKKPPQRGRGGAGGGRQWAGGCECSGLGARPHRSGPGPGPAAGSNPAQIGRGGPAGMRGGGALQLQCGGAGRLPRAHGS